MVPFASFTDAFMDAMGSLALSRLNSRSVYNRSVYALLGIAGSDFHPHNTRWANQWGAGHNGSVVLYRSAMLCARKHDLSKWPGDFTQQGRWGGVAP